MDDPRSRQKSKTLINKNQREWRVVIFQKFGENPRIHSRKDSPPEDLRESKQILVKCVCYIVYECTRIQRFSQRFSPVDLRESIQILAACYEFLSLTLYSSIDCAWFNSFLCKLKCDKLFSLQCMNECDVAPTKRIIYIFLLY